MLTVERLRQVLSYDAASGHLRWLVDRKHPSGGRGASAGDIAGRQYGADRPVVVWLDGRIRRGHLLAWALHYGELPSEQIDHINGDPTDNRIDNLRLATQAENLRNRRVPRNSQTGVMGVSWRKDKQRWRAYIMRDNRQHSLGYHEDFFEAVCARKSAEPRFGFHENHGRPAA